jgi:putative hemolysin
VRDLLNPKLDDSEITIIELVRSIQFLPGTKGVLPALTEMRAKRQHIAIVTGEQDAIVGLVTLEDAIEEIVGDINDEHESVAQYITEFGSGGWLVYGGVDLESLEKLLSISFETKHATTLAAFIMEHFNDIPKKGQTLSYKNYNFKIEKTTQKRLKKGIKI